MTHSRGFHNLCIKGQKEISTNIIITEGKTASHWVIPNLIDEAVRRSSAYFPSVLVIEQIGSYLLLNTRLLSLRIALYIYGSEKLIYE